MFLGDNLSVISSALWAHLLQWFRDFFFFLQPSRKPEFFAGHTAFSSFSFHPTTTLITRNSSSRGGMPLRQNLLKQMAAMQCQQISSNSFLLPTSLSHTLISTLSHRNINLKHNIIVFPYTHKIISQHLSWILTTFLDEFQHLFAQHENSFYFTVDSHIAPTQRSLSRDIWYIYIYHDHKNPSTLNSPLFCPAIV